MKTPLPTSENALHEVIASMLRFSIGEPGVAHDGCLWSSTEHRNAASLAEGARRKRCGVAAGQPDIWIIWRGLFHGIELKAPHAGHVSPAQMRFHEALEAAAAKVCVARSWEDVERAMVEWGVPHKGLRTC
jgi:hypothetical protein